MKVRGKLVLITGGAGAIGRSVALRFLRGGARVVLWDADAEALERALAELAPAGEARGFVVDISDRARVAVAAEQVRREAGEVDVLDNNAGIVFGGDFLSCPEERLLRTIEVNLHGVVWCTRAFLPGMIRKGEGHIVMMSSAAGLLGVPGMAVYAASKHAVVGLAESIRLELRKGGHRRIGLSIVCPGFVKTGMFEGVKPPLLTPWLSTEDISERVYDAVILGRAYVREPFMVKLVPLLKGLLSQPLLDRLGGLLGMDRAMDGWTGRPPGSRARD